MAGDVTYRDGIAILQLIFFVVYLGCGILLCTRHGFGRSSGWVILITFSLLRIIGASFQLASIHYPSRSVYGGALVCEAIGISPLTVLNIGLLVRINRFVINKITPKQFGVLSIVSMVGIAIAIHGGTKAANSDNPTGSNTTVKVAVCIFVAVFAAAVLIFLLLVRQRHHVPQGEGRLLWCFAACAPLIAVRLAYALVADFSNNHEFNSFLGNPTIYLCLSVLEEIVAVAMCVGTGLTLGKLPPLQVTETNGLGPEHNGESKSISPA